MTCNKCLVQVEDGRFAKHGIDVRRRSSVTGQRPGKQRCWKSWTAKTAAFPARLRLLDDALIFVPEESRGQKQIIRKSATERAIDIDPAMRQVYVEVDEAELGEHRGDWGRLQDALADQVGAAPICRSICASCAPCSLSCAKKTWAVTVTIWQERQVIDVQPGYVEGIYGLAVDIGSTTIAGHLCDLRTGDDLGDGIDDEPAGDLRRRFDEPHFLRHRKQRWAGDDAQGHYRHPEPIWPRRRRRAAGLQARDIHEAVFVGNTTMIHLLLGIHPQELGGAPFALANRDGMDLRAQELGLRLHPGAWSTCCRPKRGMWARIMSVCLIAEEPHKQDEIILLVDVGTNAEIVLGNREWLFSASSPTGPAFEGAQIMHGMRAAPGAIERVRIDPHDAGAALPGDWRRALVG